MGDSLMALQSMIAGGKGREVCKTQTPAREGVEVVGDQESEEGQHHHHPHPHHYHHHFSNK